MLRSSAKVVEHWTWTRQSNRLNWRLITNKRATTVVNPLPMIKRQRQRKTLTCGSFKLRECLRKTSLGVETTSSYQAWFSMQKACPRAFFIPTCLSDYLWAFSKNVLKNKRGREQKSMGNLALNYFCGGVARYELDHDRKGCVRSIGSCNFLNPAYTSYLLH